MTYHLWKCKDEDIGSAVDFKSHFRVDKSNIAYLWVPKNFYWVIAVKGELMIPNQWREVIFKVVFDPHPPFLPTMIWKELGMEVLYFLPIIYR